MSSRIRLVRRLLLLAAFAWLILPHSGAQAAQVEFSAGEKAKLLWEAGPTLAEESRFQLQWLDANESPFSPPTFRVRLWMPAHGHGSSPVEIRAVTGPDGQAVSGAFQVSKVYFTMKGLWEIRITLRAPDGSEETRALQVNMGHGHH